MNQCRNFTFCKNTIPHSQDSFVCTYCRLLFDGWEEEEKSILTFIENVHCPICKDTNLHGILQPRCTHVTCLSCFKRCYKGVDFTEFEPLFPYPEIEDDYYADPFNTSWTLQYPRIHSYLEKWLEWDSAFEEHENNTYEPYLKKCPICRS